MVEEICPECTFDGGCSKCYNKGKLDMLNAFKSQLEKAIDDTDKKAHLGMAKKFFIKTTLNVIIGQLDNAIKEGSKDA